MTPIPPLPRLFQWAGGKTKMLKHYAPLLPGAVPAYVEPFCGGAALFAHLRAQERLTGTGALGDINAELIGLYHAIAHHTESFLEHATDRSRRWAATPPDARKALYYTWRQEYWDTTSTNAPDMALLYALMRTSFNGIWQTCAPSRGKFGTPVGLTHKPGGFLDPAAVRAWAQALNGVDLHAGPYSTLPIPDGAFVFCDPPYRDSFTQYGTGFNDTDQRALIDWCRHIHTTHGATVWLANREAWDGFFEAAAPDAQRHRFSVTYTAGRRKKTDTGFAAKPATELLLIWDCNTPHKTLQHGTRLFGYSRAGNTSISPLCTHHRKTP